MDKSSNPNKNSKDSNNAKYNAMNSSEEAQNVENQTTSARKRKYDESFLQFGFTFHNSNENEQPLCLICNKLLAVESVKQSKLKRHFQSKHALYANKPKEHFERLNKSLNKEKNSLKILLQSMKNICRYHMKFHTALLKTKNHFSLEKILYCLQPLKWWKQYMEVNLAIILEKYLCQTTLSRAEFLILVRIN